MNNKKRLAFLLFVLGGTTLTVAMVKEQKSHSLVTEAMSKPVTRTHQAQVDTIFTEMKIPARLQREFTTEERRKLAFELSRLYAHNMALISHFEPKPHTPHMAPDDWAEDKLNTWEKEATPPKAEKPETESAPEDGDHTTTRVIEEAQEEMAELIKDNEGLEHLRAARGMAHLKDD